MPWAAYFDAAGCEDDKWSDSVVVMAGFVGDRWQEMIAPWKARLSKDGLTSYHATDLEDLAKAESCGWSSERLLELRRDLAGVLMRHGFYSRGYGASISKQVFEEVDAEYEVAESPAGGRYVLAGLGLIAHTLECLGMESSVAKQRTLAIFLERGDTGQQRLIDLIDAEREAGTFGFVVHAEPKRQRTGPRGSFESCPPYEAADFLAYEMRWSERQRLNDVPESEWRRTYDLLHHWLRPQRRVIDVDYVTRLCISTSIPRRRTNSSGQTLDGDCA